MKSRVIALLMLVASLVFTPGQARAQGMFYEINMGRAAVAGWDDFRAQRFGFVVAGQGMIFNSDAGQPFVGDVGCAAVGTIDKVSFGCGELSAFEMSDDLSAASAKGTFEATTFDLRTGKMVKKGAVSFSVTWNKAAGPTPHTEGGYFSDGSGLGVFATADVGRDFPDGAKGRVKAPAGTNPPTPVFARILAGPSITFDVHG